MVLLDEKRILSISNFVSAPGVSPDFAKTLNNLVVNVVTGGHGRLGQIVQARTSDGTIVALKVMMRPSQSTFDSDGSYQCEVDRRTRAFWEEYDALVALSAFRGSVKVYGRGEIDGLPTIVMEWVEGASLRQIAALLEKEDAPLEARVRIVADMGKALFSLLARTQEFVELFVHRDISPANVMVRTDKRRLDEQVAQGDFDLCLIDFGSAITLRMGDGSFTTDTRILRGATPDFAPPEMLTNDLPNLDVLRKSPSIDVYAASSVLYWLLCGHAPFDLSSDATQKTTSAYVVKTTSQPIEPGFPKGSSAYALAHVLLEAVKPSQAQRPSAQLMLLKLEEFDVRLRTGALKAAENLANASPTPPVSLMRNSGSTDVQPNKRNKKRGKVIAALVVAVLAIGAFAAFVSPANQAFMNLVDPRPTWSGSLTGTSVKYVCPDVQDALFTVSIKDEKASDSVTLEARFAIHEHYAAFLITGSDTHPYISVSNVSAKREGSTISFETQPSDNLKPESSYKVTLSWDGEGDNPQRMKAYVTSYYDGSEIVDEYELTRK